MKPQVIILSGWGYPALAWTEATRALTPGCDCHVLEAPALTALPAEEIVPCLSDCLRAADAPCYLVGWSMGGMLALQLAASLPPLSGLLLIAATPRFRADDRQSWGAPPATLRAMGVGLRRDREQTLRAFYALSASPHPPPNPARCATWMDALDSDPYVLAQGLAYLMNADLRDGAGVPPLPITLLHGAEDQVVPLDAAHALARALPQAKLEILPGAGHDLPISHPARVADAVGDLIRRTEPGPDHDSTGGIHP